MNEIDSFVVVGIDRITAEDGTAKAFIHGRVTVAGRMFDGFGSGHGAKGDHVGACRSAAKSALHSALQLYRDVEELCSPTSEISVSPETFAPETLPVVVPDGPLAEEAIPSGLNPFPPLPPGDVVERLVVDLDGMEDLSRPVLAAWAGKHHAEIGALGTRAQELVRYLRTRGVDWV